MAELSPEARRMLAQLRDLDDPTPAERERGDAAVRRVLEARGLRSLPRLPEHTLQPLAATSAGLLKLAWVAGASLLVGAGIFGAQLWRASQPAEAPLAAAAPAHADALGLSPRDPAAPPHQNAADTPTHEPLAAPHAAEPAASRAANHDTPADRHASTSDASASELVAANHHNAFRHSKRGRSSARGTRHNAHASRKAADEPLPAMDPVDPDTAASSDAQARRVAIGKQSSAAPSDASARRDVTGKRSAASATAPSSGAAAHRVATANRQPATGAAASRAASDAVSGDGASGQNAASSDPFATTADASARRAGSSSSTAAAASGHVAQRGSAELEEDSLAAELRFVASVDAEIRAGAYDRALRRLEQHKGGPSLQEERAAMRVLALCGRDGDGQAARERERFLKAHPNAVLSARVRAACMGASSP